MSDVVNFNNSTLTNVGGIFQPTHKMVTYESRTPSGNTTSTSYVNMPGNPTTPAITKSDGTDLFVEMFVGYYFNTVIGRCDTAIRVNGVDHAVAISFTNTTDEHQTSSGSVRINGLPAGSYTGLGRWKNGRTGGGSMFQNADDYTLIRITEV